MTKRRGLLVVPANNTTMEPEMNALCPDLAPFMVARVPRPARTLTVDDLPAYRAATLQSVEPFLDQKPDVVVYGCTAAGFLGGPDGNALMVDALQECTGVPVVSTAGAMQAVLEEEGVDRTAVVTPYLPAVNDGLRAYLDSAGIQVEVLDSFLCQTVAELGDITEAQVREKALATVTEGSRSLFIACSQLPTLNIVPELRASLGIPVWSSIRATARAVEQVLAKVPA
ncbi:MAG: aspartate/glutamate racemase family protein [Acetobacteraceae bacterium]